MRIKQVISEKERFMDLLYLGDEDENMISKYLKKSNMFLCYDGNELVGQITVLRLANKIYEIKNLSIYESYQGKGYGSKLVKFIFDHYKNKASVIILGTGECDKTISFYENLGFKYFMRKKNFFIDNYDHEMYEEDKKLIDMLYFKRVI